MRWSIRKDTYGLPSVVADINGIPLFENEIVSRKEKWVTLSNDALSLMQLLDVDVEFLKGEKKTVNADNNLTPGSIYAVGREKVEGVEFGCIYFRVYGIIREYKGVNLDSVIVKEVIIDDDGNIIEGENPTGRRKFSIPPSMCKMFGIEYSPGFELWPMDSGFIKVDTDTLVEKDETEINYGNLATYPTSEIDGTIRKLILELHGFSPFNNSHIITPTGAMIPTSDFVSSLTIFARQNISTDNGCAGFRMGEILPYKIVGREKDNKIFSICDENHNIYVEVDLTKESLNANTADGIVGVAHTALDGKDIDDVIGVKWDESTDVNDDKKEKAEVKVDTDKIFEALDKHFNRMDRILSRSSRVGYWNGLKLLDY